jgi:Ca2+-binding EF-hand superfamily protein
MQFGRIGMDHHDFLHLETACDAMRIAVRWLFIASRIVEARQIRHGKRRSFWMLVTGLMSSSGTLIASCLVLMFFSLAVGILLVDVFHEIHVDPNDPEAPNFGTVLSSLFELLAISRADNAENTMEAIEHVGTAMAEAVFLFLELYKLLVELVIFNLITAVIVDNAMKVVRSDKDQKREEQAKKKQKQIQELGTLFEKLDADGSGEIDLDEFRHSSDRSFQRKLEILGIDAEDIEEMFKALDTSGTDTSQPTVSLTEFVSGLPQFFGQCRAFNILIVTKKLEWALTLLQDSIAAVSAGARGRKSRLSMASSFTPDQTGNTSDISEVEQVLNKFEKHFDGELNRLDDRVEECLQHCEVIAGQLRKAEKSKADKACEGRGGRKRIDMNL